MGISVQNITANTAMVIWPSISNCADSFYSVMYQSNWNTMMSEYSKKNFQKEERIPTSRTYFTIENLTPLTTYILCVTCQSATPTSDQCKIFQTSDQDPATVNSKKKDLALGIWLTSTILLLIIACILIYGCLHIWWRKRQERAREQNGGSSEQCKREAWAKNGGETIIKYEDNDHITLKEESKGEETCIDNAQLTTVTHYELNTDYVSSLNSNEHDKSNANLTTKT